MQQKASIGNTAALSDIIDLEVEEDESFSMEFSWLWRSIIQVLKFMNKSIVMSLHVTSFSISTSSNDIYHGISVPK